MPESFKQVDRGCQCCEYRATQERRSDLDICQFLSGMVMLLTVDEYMYRLWLASENSAMLTRHTFQFSKLE